jgi:hypothetical protein
MCGLQISIPTPKSETGITVEICRTSRWTQLCHKELSKIFVPVRFNFNFSVNLAELQLVEASSYRSCFWYGKNSSRSRYIAIAHNFPKGYEFIVEFLLQLNHSRHLFNQLKSTTISLTGARGSIVGWGTMLKAVRSWVWIPMRSLDFSIDLTLPAALWPWDRLSLLTEMNTRNLHQGQRVAGA